MIDTSHLALGDLRAILAANLCGAWSCGLNVNTTHAWLVPHQRGVNFTYLDGHYDWLNANMVFTTAQCPGGLYPLRY